MRRCRTARRTDRRARQNLLRDSEIDDEDESWRSLSERLRWRNGVKYPAHRSFGFDPGFLDDRPPLLDLGLLKGAERIRRLLAARHDLLPEVGEPLAHGRVGQRAHRGCVELGDD